MSPATVTLTHANLNAKVEVAVALMSAWYHSPANRCTHVVMSGGATFPATESVEQIGKARLLALAGATAAPDAAANLTLEGQ